MRTAVLLLLLANLAFFAFSHVDGSDGGEAARLKQQVRPELIKLMTPPQVAALGPAKMAALADVCIEWGPFSDTDRSKALADLDSLQLGRLLSQRRVDLDSTYWVNVGPFTSRGAADRRLTELRSQGVSDVSTVDIGRGQYAVSLGVYRTEQAANTRADALGRQGITGARVEPRQQLFTQTMLVVRDPQQPVVARIRDLQPQYSGSDLRIGACPSTS